MRRLTAAVSAIACMGIVIAGTAAPVEAGSTEKLAAHAKYQRQAHNVTNKQRVAHGLTELKRADCVQRFAVRQAKAMAASKTMSHQNLVPILSKCKLAAAGENVAFGYPNGRSVVNEGWMKSLGHRAVILNPVYRLVGVGARKGDDGVWYVAQVFGTAL